MNDLTGTQLGNYRLLRLLGSGGFADVYLGEHLYLKTQVAVKVLQTSLAEDEEQQSFLREARMLSDLHHPHIIQVLDFGITGATPYLVLDYAPHGNLRQRHPTGARVPLPSVVGYVTQIASSLHYAHEHRVIHRDVKPENLLLGAQGEILLSDFGIALIAPASSSHSRQDIVGTLDYMAPEQITGRPRPASDQYSLAALTYEWLSGAPPFKGATYLDIARQQLHAPVPPLNEKVPDLPPAVVQVITRALAKDPRQRFESIGGFATALEQAYRFGTVPGAAEPGTRSEAASLEQPPSTRERVKRTEFGDEHKMPRRVALGLVGGAGVLLVGGGLVGWRLFFSLRSGSNRPTRQVQISTPSPPTSVPSSTPLTGERGMTVYTYRGLSTTPGKAPIETIVWSPDGQNIVASSAQLLTAWQAFTGREFVTKNDYSEGGTRPDGTLDRNNGGGTEEGAAWSPDGRLVASNTLDGAIHIWRAADGRDILRVSGNGSLAWSPTGTYLAIGNSFGPAQIVKASDGTVVTTYQGHADAGPNRINSIAWSFDERSIASGGADGTIQVWEALTGKRISTYNGVGANQFGIAPYIASSSAWSRDGKDILSCWVDGVHISQALTGQSVRVYKGHADQALTAAWSPDGTQIASGGMDNTVQIWDPATGGLIFLYPHHTLGIECVAWSPDGHFIASGGYDKLVHVWIS